MLGAFDAAWGQPDRMLEALRLGLADFERVISEQARSEEGRSVTRRAGRTRHVHVANVTAESVRPLIVTNTNRASALMSDESKVYPKIGDSFAPLPCRIRLPYNNRFGLGVEDVARADKAMKNMAGKRLMYQAPRQAANA
jgi:hypothetical protein